MSPRAFVQCFRRGTASGVAARAVRGVRARTVPARWLTGAVGALFVLLAARLATLERN
jgi:hypothetical protein